MPDFKIDSDAVRIRQILVNLIGNAIKFTTQGGVSVRGKFEPIETDSLRITLCVSDTGIGITSDQAAGLFQAFTQADNTTTRHYGGTGLGLALSKKLANAMGGTISIEENNDAKGTTFLIQITAKRSVVRKEVISSAPIAQPNISKKRLLDFKILVVDDSEDNRTLMRILLEREGAVVHLAPSAEEGITLAHALDFDLVLMDIQMPELDGFEALSRLRRENYKKPVFALTAHTMKEERDRATAAGFSGHISKPVNAAVLVDTLLRHARQLN